jgi:EAL domain-containing protein (putative c-di-GMP-specific phosphodiesterase class I)
MVAGLNEFANRLGVTLIAEGIELEEERRMLIDLMVTRGQGFLFGRPVTIDELPTRRPR